jgi:hypothetical protein
MKQPIIFTDIDSVDFQALLYAEMGLSNRFIHKETGLTSSQIYYRTRQAKVFRRDYRDGTNDMAKRAISKISTLVTKKEQKDKGEVFNTTRDKFLKDQRKVEKGKNKK